ncbi:MAG: TlpA family protein disulfide reductase [Candidatus Heimdallarchaeota archaeon]|nr:MAG: TlpA family protein disulfide reductase [Candidatus Heimdallarchaeota archaeon]
MARRTIKIPQKQSKELEMSESKKVSDIISSIDSIQGKQQKMSSTSSSIPITKIILAFAFLSIISLGVFSLGNYQLAQSNPTEGNISDKLNFSFELLNGEMVMLSDYAGKPIILDLMATWCVPCKTQIGELKTLRMNYPSVEIVSVSIDPSYDSISKLTEYKNDNGITWTVGRDTTQAGKEKFSATSIPTVAFINSAGKLKQINQGVVFYDTLVDWITSG